MNYRRSRVSDGRPNVSNDFCHRLPQLNESQFRFNPLLHYPSLQRPYMLNNTLPSTTTFTNRGAPLLEWMTRIAPVSTHIPPPISLVYSSPVIVDVPSDSVPLDLTMSRHSYYMPQRSLCEAAIDMSFVAGRGISSMQHGENLSSFSQRSSTSDVMLEALPSGGSEGFIPSGRGKKSRGSRCGGNTRTGRKRGSKNQGKTPQKKQTTLAGSCLSPTRTMEAVAGLLMLPESSSPGSTVVSGSAGEASTPKRPKTPRKSRKPTNYRPIDYLTQSRNYTEEAAAAAAADFAVIDSAYGHAATGLEGETISSGTAVTFENTLSQFCRLLESSCCSTTSTGSVSMQNSLPVASCATVTATETQTSPARSNVCPPVLLRAERFPRSSESKATETLVSTAENGCQTDDDPGAICLDCIRNPSLSNTWTTKEMEVDCASGLRSPLPVDVDFSGEVGSLLPSLNLPQMKQLIQRLQWRVQMLEEQAIGDGSSADGHLLPSDSFGCFEPLFDSTAVVASEEPERSYPHELSESEESLHLRLSESDDFVDLEQQQLLDSHHRSPDDSDHLPSAVDSAAPVDAEPGEKSRDFALSGKIGDLKRKLQAIENRFVTVETRDAERNSDDVFPGDFDSVGCETDGGISVASCHHASEKQNLSTVSSASQLAEYVVCADEKSDAGMMMMMMIRPPEADDCEFHESATVTPQQNSQLSTVMDQMASLDFAEGNEEVLSNYQSKLLLETISPPSSVVSLHDDETGDMDLNLEENDNTDIAHEIETNELLEGLSNVVNDDYSGKSNCREIISIGLSIPIAENSLSDSIFSRVTCASDNIHIGNIVSAESNTHDNVSDGGSVCSSSSSSSLRVDAFDNTSAYIGTCDASDIAPDRVSQTDTGVPDEIDDRSHEMQAEVDDVDDTRDEGAERSDSAEEREKPEDANTESSENELASICIESVGPLSDSLESSVGATEATRAADDACHAHDANDHLTVETFSEEVTIDVNKHPLSGEGHHNEKTTVSDLSSGFLRTLLDARVVIERLDLDAILEMKTKVKDYKPVVSQWLHKPGRPRHRCRKTKSKGKPVHRPLHCDHNYVQPASDRIDDSCEVPKHILQNVYVVPDQQSNDMSTSVEPHDVMLHDVTPHDVTPHDVELVMTFPLSFNSGVGGTHVDYFGTAVSSGSDLEPDPRLHQDDSTAVQENSVDDVDAEVEISFTSNCEVLPEEDSERDYECADSYTARCSESSVAMAVVNGVAVSVDDGRQAPQREPSVVADCAGATFGNCDKSVLDILETDAATVESDDLTGSSAVFVCTDEPRTSNVPTATDREIDKAVKNLRTISQMVKKLSTGGGGGGGGESGACDNPQETPTHFPSYPDDKKASKEASLRRLPVQSPALDSSDISECGTAEDLLNVATPDGKEIALEHDGEVERDGSVPVLLPGSGNVGCLERTGGTQNSDWPGEETDAVGCNLLAADGEQGNASDHPDHMITISSGDRLADDSIDIVASQNAPRKRGRKPKARQSCSVSNDDCKDITALPHGAGKAFDEHGDRGGVSATESIQRKRRGRPPRRSFDDHQSSTRPEKTTKYDVVETDQDTAPVFLLVKGHSTSKQHGRNLFSEISPSNVVSEVKSSSSVCSEFSLRNSSEAEDRQTKRPIGGRTGRPPKHQRRSGDDQDTKQQQCSPRETSTNGSRTLEINCRRYKTKDLLQTQRASNRNGDEDQRYTRQAIPLLKTINSTGEVVIRKMHVNICRGQASMVVDVISKAPSGVRLAQCLFCEFLAPSIQDIGRHLDDCHSEFVLVISKVRVSQESSTRYFCRHCQFVTVDHTVMWIHFEISHNVRGILTSENRVDSVLGGQDPDEVQPLSLDLSVHFDRVYMCPECGNLIENRKTMISHVVRCHTTTENYCNGNFVKSIALTKPRNVPEQPTYRSLVMDDAFCVYRKPCYICVFCQFVVFEARLALSHFICLHVKKKLLMVCMKDSCGQRFVKERRFYEHVKQRHDGLDLGAYFDCSVTLLEEDSEEIAEVALPSVRDGSRS